jgi:hypothetical protein
MSLHAFMTARKALSHDPPFYALIMAAMSKADDDNLCRLREQWPQVWEELNTRYWSPGGLVPGEEGFRYTEWRGIGNPDCDHDWQDDLDYGRRICRTCRREEGFDGSSAG